MSSSDAVLTTLLLKKGAVRLYSNLDSDVGKRVVITDKFNPLSVKEGTLDASLNLLYELPAFTTYNVKMYGLDGETVESNQNFKLDGYSYVEMNVGLNKNSFAGIKAIVDQGLESTMLHVGDEWIEEDYGNLNHPNLPVKWVIVAIDYQTNTTELYRHNVMIARKNTIDATSGWQWYPTALDTYYESLPTSIKNTLALRHCHTASAGGSDQGVTANKYVWLPDTAELIVNGRVSTNQYNSGDYAVYAPFPYYVQSASNRAKKVYEGGTLASYWCRSLLTYTQDYHKVYVDGNGNLSYLSSASADTTAKPLAPHMMIASEPIE